MARETLLLEYLPRHVMETGVLSAVEAILPWPHRRLSGAGAAVSAPLPVIDPALATMLSAWMFQAACIEAASWDRQDLRLSVKLVTPQLSGEELCLQIARALEETGLAPERLELSIPEHLVFGLEDDASMAFASLRDTDINLLLDEFGHLYASLIAMREIPLTSLKVDRVMLRSLPLDEENLTVVRAIIGTSHALGLHVCADGVDSDAQRAMLLTLGVDEGQGRAFSPPLSRADLQAYLRR